MQEMAHKKDKQMYIIRKYIMAKSAGEALKRESKVPVRDVYIDDEWRKSKNDQLASSIGFDVYVEEE